MLAQQSRLLCSTAAYQKIIAEIGEGSSQVLLHGALSAIGTSFGKLLPSLAKTRQIIAIEQQAHVHTADIDRSLSIEQMANNTTALLWQLEIEKADIFGWSMGAGVALQIVLQQPDMVNKLVVASVAYNNDGVYPEVLEGEENLKPENFAGTLWQEEYSRIAPRPEDWPALIEKVKRIWFTDLSAYQTARC